MINKLIDNYLEQIALALSIPARSAFFYEKYLIPFLHKPVRLGSGHAPVHEQRAKGAARHVPIKGFSNALLLS
jgi:hypothetical protein